MAKRIVQIPFPAHDGITPIDPKFISEAIKAKRTSLGFTQHDAAMYCNVPVEVFTKLENLKMNITLVSFLSVINGLGLKIDIKE